MKTLVRSLFVAGLIALAGSAAPAAAQQVWVDVRIGAPHYQYRHYRSGHRWYRQYREYHRSYGWRYARPIIVVSPRAHYGGRVVWYRDHRDRGRRHSRWH